MGSAPLTPVADALAAILGSARRPEAVETVPLRGAAGRTLAQDLAALRTQPPCDVSAMDGYAVRAADLATLPAVLAVLGESAAGRAFPGHVGPGQAARIFTGAPVPPGADAVVLQENTEGGTVGGETGTVRVLGAEPLGRHIRRAGQDFREGEVLLRAGKRLGAADVALAAAMNHAALPVFRRPRVAVLATGDELVQPGGAPGPGQIVASNSFAVMALAEAAGAEAIDLGIAPDDMGALAGALARARDGGADLLVTLGGASVGDHDLVQRALVAEGMELGFWRIAMRPGKPLMHGHLGPIQVLGLPGNPVSAIVCGMLFVAPLVRALAGDRHAGDDPTEAAVLAEPMGANDGRQDYVRSRILPSPDGVARVAAGSRQDSSLLKALSDADCLIVRPPNAPPAPAGTPCRIIRLAALGA
ncbi:molybdopterin molybdotransferase MoeA [Lichenibacterium dinghuense]|uniref:molybdopterin molybdotransferase MoeA n=1 Tax=Lichenibacterium dinghuense TaxID=2895977 RepID=UPI001F2C3358|nr:gephyrin-like molybdotransferase Glp [Lichenibacterium sp. 6Y81]